MRVRAELLLADFANHDSHRTHTHTPHIVKTSPQHHQHCMGDGKVSREVALLSSLLQSPAAHGGGKDASIKGDWLPHRVPRLRSITARLEATRDERGSPKPPTRQRRQRLSYLEVFRRIAELSIHVCSAYGHRSVYSLDRDNNVSVGFICSFG